MFFSVLKITLFEQMNREKLKYVFQIEKNCVYLQT